jgi:plastocyanin
MSGRTWRGLAALLLVAGIGGFVGVGPAGAATTQVDMENQRFNPSRVQVTMGDFVQWEARDDEHTVTARDGSFDSSSRGVMVQGDEFRLRFKTPGTFEYFCRVHADRGMVGQIVVIDPSAPTTATTRLTPVSAAATTSSAPTTTTTAPTTTTSRVLATSSSTSPSIATSTTASEGAPVAPQEPPTLNPDAPVVGSGSGGDLPEAQAAAQRSDDSTAGRGVAVLGIGLGLVAILAITAGTISRRRSRRTG